LILSCFMARRHVLLYWSQKSYKRTEPNDHKMSWFKARKSLRSEQSEGLLADNGPHLDALGETRQWRTYGRRTM